MLDELKTKLDSKGNEPKYSQMARMIEDWLKRNCVSPGTRLPSERSLAAHFGVTCMTVNRSLNELVQRNILERKIGSGTYVVDRSRHSCIGIVCHEEALSSDYYMGNVLKTLRQYWNGRAELISLVQGPENYNTIIEKYKLSGMIILSLQEESVPAILKLRESDYPVVAIGATLPQLGNISFGTDHQFICRQAVEYLISHGCCKIGILSVNTRKTSVLERERGYTKAMYEARLPVDPDWIIRKNEPEEELPYDFFRSIMRRADRPDAFLIASHYDFIPFYNLINELHLRIPDDISIIGFDDPHYVRHLVPALTVFKQPIHEFTLQASEQLETLLRRQPAKELPHCEAILIERNSCRTL